MQLRGHHLCSVTYAFDLLWLFRTRDLHDVHVDDVLASKRQAEVEDTVRKLARFRPTKVAVEWSRARADSQYAKYLAGSLAPSRNEVVQLGFRLAKEAGLPRVDGVDVGGDFPYEPVQRFAETHGAMTALRRFNARVEAQVRRQQTEGSSAKRYEKTTASQHCYEK